MISLDKEGMQCTQGDAKPVTVRCHSIVRIIGSKLPITIHRVYYQKELLVVSRHDETSQSVSEFLWHAPAPVTLADIKWLVVDPGDPGILTRAQLVKDFDPPQLSPIAIHRRPQSTPCHCSCLENSNSSRTQSSLNDSATPDPAAARRISALEAELNLLKQQLASIVINQEQSGVFTDQSGASLPSCLLTPPPQPPPSSFAPPPPPPPLPPPPPPPSSMSNSALDLIKERRKQRMTSGPGNSLLVPDMTPNMSDVLKGLGSVRLRSVKRSPGGTPMRQKPRSCDVNDPVALIANALKKKFSHRQTWSPDLDKENLVCRSPDSFKHTLTPPGPHLLKNKKKFKRRSQTSPLEKMDVNS